MAVVVTGSLMHKLMVNGLLVKRQLNLLSSLYHPNIQNQYNLINDDGFVCWLSWWAELSWAELSRGNSWNWLWVECFDQKVIDKDIYQELWVSHGFNYSLALHKLNRFTIKTISQHSLLNAIWDFPHHSHYWMTECFYFCEEISKCHKFY